MLARPILRDCILITAANITASMLHGQSRHKSTSKASKAHTSSTKTQRQAIIINMLPTSSTKTRSLLLHSTRKYFCCLLQSSAVLLQNLVY